MKVLYVKNGNVTAQIGRLGANPQAGPDGGPDAFLADLLSKNNAEKLLISWDVVDESLSEEKLMAITYKVSGGRITTLKKMLLRSTAFIKSAYHIIVFNPDRIICGRVGAMLWQVFVLSKILRCPYIHSRHNSLETDAESIKAALPLWLDKFCIRHAAGVICHGPYLADQVLEIGVKPSKVFDFDVGYKNFIDDKSLDEAIIKRINNRKVLLYVGRMAANKGIYDLLASVQSLREKGIDLFVIYIGGGTEVQVLKDVVNKQDMADQVEIIGKVSHDLLPAYIYRSFLMVTPTRKEFPEGRCMAAMEGLACGIPVLAPDNGPFPYLVKDGINGLLYEVDNVDAMSDKIASVVNDEAKYKTLLSGAEQSKRKLEKPDLTFNEAIEQAFITI